MIVRLKELKTHSKNNYFNMFQFYDSPIKSFVGVTQGTYYIVTFQFYDSPIKSVQRNVLK